MPLLVEIKAKCASPEKIRTILEENKAVFKGIDHQIDTYFKANHGRLKLREGTIENNLIQYFRENTSHPKASKVALYKSKPESTLKEVLSNALGVLVVVDKKRAIYFIDNVKFHIDQVNGLGSFMEIEAIDDAEVIGEAKLLEQCNYFIKLLGVKEEDLVTHSYSDLLLQLQAT